MELIFNDFGIAIIKQDGRYFVQYDSGEIASTIRRIEVSEIEARELQEQRDVKSVYNYMIKNLNDRI